MQHDTHNPETLSKVWQPSLADRAWTVQERARLAAARSLLPALAPAGSISGLDPATLARWADGSHYTGVIPPEVIKKHFHGVFAKCCDGEVMRKGGSESRLKDFTDETFHDQVQSNYEAGAPCIPYIYWQPVVRYNKDYASKHTYEVFKYATQGLKPGVSFHGVCIDFEQSGDTSTNGADKMLALWELLRKDPELAETEIFFARKPIYTSVNVLTSYYPAVIDRTCGPTHNYDFWLAQWAKAGTLTGSWEEIDAYLNSIIMRVKTPGYATWRWLQVMGGVMIPEMASLRKSGVGVTFFKGTPEACYQFIGYKQAQPPTTPPPQTPPGDVAERLAALEESDGKLAARLEQLEQLAHPKAHTHPISITQEPPA